MYVYVLGDVSSLRRELSLDISGLNYRNSQGWTPLIVAVANNKYEAVQLVGNINWSMSSTIALAPQVDDRITDTHIP